MDPPGEGSRGRWSCADRDSACACPGLSLGEAVEPAQVHPRPREPRSRPVVRPAARESGGPWQSSAWAPPAGLPALRALRPSWPSARPRDGPVRSFSVPAPHGSTCFPATCESCWPGRGPQLLVTVPLTTADTVASQAESAQCSLGKAISCVEATKAASFPLLLPLWLCRSQGPSCRPVPRSPRLPKSARQSQASTTASVSTLRGWGALGTGRPGLLRQAAPADARPVGRAEARSAPLGRGRSWVVLPEAFCTCL